MGDPFFDLGNFSINHELTEAQDRILLAAYDGEVTARRLAAPDPERVVSDFREAMWCVLQQGVSSLDIDFVAYASEHFQRLLANAAQPRFEAASPSSRAGPSDRAAGRPLRRYLYRARLSRVRRHPPSQGDQLAGATNR